MSWIRKICHIHWYIFSCDYLPCFIQYKCKCKPISCCEHYSKNYVRVINCCVFHSCIFHPCNLVPPLPLPVFSRPVKKSQFITTPIILTLWWRDPANIVVKRPSQTHKPFSYFLVKLLDSDFNRCLIHTMQSQTTDRRRMMAETCTLCCLPCCSNIKYVCIHS